MATKKKYKKLTNSEKKLNKEIRAEMREEGILPPVKPKLNRKKFAKETIDEFKETFNLYSDLMYLRDAISVMLPSKYGKVTLEQIGIVKMLKIAMEIKRYKKELQSRGETTYSLADMYEKVITPIEKL